MNKVKAFLTANAKMLGIWSGVTALIAWLLSNTLLEMAKTAESALDKVREERAALRQARENARWKGNVEKQLTRIENRLPIDEIQWTDAKKNLVNALNNASFFPLARSDADELVEAIRRGMQIARKVTNRYDTKLQNLLERAEEYSKQVHQINERCNKEVVAGGISISTILDEEAIKKTSTFWDLHRELNQISGMYRDVNNDFSRVFAEIEKEAESTAFWRKWITRIINLFALTLAFVGSVLAVLGKYYEEKAKKDAAVSEASTPAPSSEAAQPPAARATTTKVSLAEPGAAADRGA